MLKDIAYTWDGTYNRTMDRTSAFNSILSTKARRKRTSPEKSQGCAQRYFMGAADRNTRERSAAALSLVSNLPSIVPDLGLAGGIKTYFDRTGRGSAPTRGHRYSCNLYRWQFQPPKRGKGVSTTFQHRSHPFSLSHKSMPIRAEKPLKINLIEATIGFHPG